MDGIVTPTCTLPSGSLFALGTTTVSCTATDRLHNTASASFAVTVADKTGPVFAQMQSLNMLICTEGKERSLPEYRDLLTKAGFTRIEGRRTGLPLDAILAQV